MKSPITLARELQREGKSISFWFYDHCIKEIEINIHHKDTIKSYKVSTIKEVREILSKETKNEPTPCNN
jgi:hypothetical protein